MWSAGEQFQIFCVWFVWSNCCWSVVWFTLQKTRRVNGHDLHILYLLPVVVMKHSTAASHACFLCCQLGLWWIRSNCGWPISISCQQKLSPTHGHCGGVCLSVPDGVLVRVGTCSDWSDTNRTNRCSNNPTDKHLTHIVCNLIRFIVTKISLCVRWSDPGPPSSDHQTRRHLSTICL